MGKSIHKRVRERLDEVKTTITDEEFFTSSLLAKHFELIASAQTGRYGSKSRIKVLIFWDLKERDVAWTDNRKIYINAAHPFVMTAENRVARYQLITGLFAHELGHILYTDFLKSQTHLNAIKNRRWFPYAPNLDTKTALAAEKELWKFVKQDEQQLKFILKVVHDIANVIEDGYIENRMLIEYPGSLGDGLEAWRAVQFGQIDTVSVMKEWETTGAWHIYKTILQNILSYVKYGKIKYGSEPYSDERIQTVFDLIPTLDKGRLSKNPKERLASVNEVVIHCWKYIKDFYEYSKDKQEEDSKTGGKSSLEEMVDKLLGDKKGDSIIGKGGGKPVVIENEEELSEEAESTSKASEKTKRLVLKISLAKSSESKSETEGTATVLDCETGGGETPSEIKPEEGGRIPLQETDEIDTSGDGGIAYDPDYEREKYDKAASDVERLLDGMAEKAACKELEEERLNELNGFAGDISYGDVHREINKRIFRISQVDEDLISQYDEIAPALVYISKQLQKNIRNKIIDARRGGKLTGQVIGRRIESRNLFRNDGKFFYKTNLPNDVELAVGVVVDESGSMSWGDRATYARAASIILYDFCSSLNIPIAIYGHTSAFYKKEVQLHSYAEFDTFDDTDKYRLMDIRARENNRDGAAVRFVAERLLRRPETTKLLIIISDGQPWDSGYTGTAAEEDLRGIKQEYKQKGIVFVAAAIGDDKENIERIYGDSFLDITDLNELPVKLTDIIKRHIRL